MRVALIAPPFRGSARGVPLGLAQLASVLHAHDFQVDALDLTISADPATALQQFVVRVQPDVVGLSTVCATYLSAVETAEACRLVLGCSAKIVAGGPHVTFGAENILQRRTCFDVCVLGEAERSFLQLCQGFDRGDWKSTPGIAFRDGPQIRQTSRLAMVENLDELPLPSRAYFLQGDYPHAHLDAVGLMDAGRGHKAEVLASRGCPYPCGFCSTKEFWGRSYRTRSPQHVVAELAMLKELGHTDIYFNDDIFTVKRRWVIALCEELIRQDLRMRWACGTRVDRVDEELITLMRAAGCVYVYYGVETGSDLINDGQKKGASIAKIERAYSLLRDAGIFSSAAIIFGLPGETWDSARTTVDWLRDVVRPDEVWISKAACYPGTALARDIDIDASDYEIREGGRCSKGLPYGTGGILTPFFNNVGLVERIWQYARHELRGMSVAFGDDFGMPTTH